MMIFLVLVGGCAAAGEGRLLQQVLACYFFISFSSFVCVFGCSDGKEREACVCDHGFERSDLCAEIIIISTTYFSTDQSTHEIFVVQLIFCMQSYR